MLRQLSGGITILEQDNNFNKLIKEFAETHSFYDYNAEDIKEIVSSQFVAIEHFIKTQKKLKEYRLYCLGRITIFRGTLTRREKILLKVIANPKSTQETINKAQEEINKITIAKQQYDTYKQNKQSST
jgi:hypothetical protein